MAERNIYPYSEMDFTDIIGAPEIRETPDGLYAAARCYLDGKGVESNYDAYLAYLDQAASIGSQRAKDELEELEEKRRQEEEKEEEDIPDDEESTWDPFQDDLDDDTINDFDDDYDTEDNQTSFSDEPDNSAQLLSFVYEPDPHATDLVTPTYTSHNENSSAAEKLEAVKAMASVDLYEEADAGNPYACFEIFRLNKDSRDEQTQKLADQCLDKASGIAEQNGDLDFCRIIFKEAGEYYADKDINKSLEYSGKASELGDTSSSLRLAQYYLSKTNGMRDEAQGLRYLDLAGTGSTDEETYEIGNAYMDCGRPLKGKSLIARLLKKENINQNLWFTCALTCPEFTTPEETAHHAWAAEDISLDIQSYLLNYYGQNQNSTDLNTERIFLLAKWERDSNGISGLWMQRAALIGIPEAVSVWEADQKAVEQEQKERALADEARKVREEKEKKEQAEKDSRDSKASICMVLLFVSIIIGAHIADNWVKWMLDIIIVLVSIYLCYNFFKPYREYKEFRIIMAVWFILLILLIIHDFFSLGLSFVSFAMRLLSLVFTLGWALFRYPDLSDDINQLVEAHNGK